MKLYDKYKESIKAVGTLKKAYFTTYNIDIEFIETYILPPLLGEDNPDNKFSMEDLNNPLMEKTSPDIKFFYDLNMSSSLNKRTLVDMNPVLQEGGVFHPKVIYLKGDKKTYLLVGSGNLSINGWGRNIEAFEIIDITNLGNLENQVLNFFDEVFKLANLKQRTKERYVDFDDELNFIYSFEKKDSSEFLNVLNLNDTLQVFSPYFSDLDELFDNDEFNMLQSIHIVPDLIENQKIRLERLPDDKRVTFHRFEQEKFNKKNVDSTNHSKVWLSETRYAIGSYNCTKQALYGYNFEASLVRSYKNKDEFDINNFKKIDKLEVSGKNEKEEGEIDENTNFFLLFSLIADYSDYTLKLEPKSEYENEILILLPSFTKLISYDELNQLSMERRVRIFRALNKNKHFEIQDKKTKNILFRGFILERNATNITRVVEVAETLDDIFASFLDAKKPTEGIALKNRTYDINDNEDVFYKRKKKFATVNYFTMFTGFKNLNKKFDTIKNKPKELERFCYTSSCSLEVAKNVVNEQELSLFTYLTAEELDKLIRRVNKKGQKMKELKMTMKLSKKDKAFIRAMK